MAQAVQQGNGVVVLLAQDNGPPAQYGFDRAAVVARVQASGEACVTAMAQAARAPVARGVGACAPAVPAPAADLAAVCVLDRAAAVGRRSVDSATEACFETPNSCGSRVARWGGAR